jgi:hypothetical protein
MAGGRRKMEDWVVLFWRIMNIKPIMLIGQLGLDDSFIAAVVASRGVCC